jgi:hypothetical protein
VFAPLKMVDTGFGACVQDVASRSSSPATRRQPESKAHWMVIGTILAAPGSYQLPMIISVRQMLLNGGDRRRA